MENLKIDCCGFTDKQKQEVVYELNRLGFITGHKSVDFYCFIYGCTGNTSYNNTIQFGNTAKTFAKNKGQEVTLDELKQIPSEGSQTEQGLISGADALRAFSDGKEVYVHESTYKKDIWFDLRKTKFTPSEILEEKVSDKPYKLTFRYKPDTITLNLEIPAPFEPKVGETYYFITTSNSQGFDFTEFEDSDGDKLYMQLGAYRSALDASKAFEAMCGGIKG